MNLLVCGYCRREFTATPAGGDAFRSHLRTHPEYVEQQQERDSRKPRGKRVTGLSQRTTR